jgi:hypothetical protein
VRQLLLLLVIALGACAPRIQADDPEAFQQTAEAAMADMDAGTRRQFIQAIYSIREGSTKELSEAELADPETWRDHNAQLAEWVDGRSADEVIQRGYEARLRLLRERLRDADSRLQQSRDLTRPHVARMAAVRVEGARFYQSGNALREMAVSFRLTNGTDQPLRRVRFRGLVSSRGRTLVDDTISYDLEEPLAPGESRDFDLVTSFGAFADPTSPCRSGSSISAAAAPTTISCLPISRTPHGSSGRMPSTGSCLAVCRPSMTRSDSAQLRGV